MAAFPFGHMLLLEARLLGATLTIVTTVRATDAVVPISFGYHPYFRLPGVDRADWQVDLPVTERLMLDARMLPTGEREAVQVAEGPLGSRTFDDGYLAPEGGAPFVLAGGGRRIEVAFDDGYPFAQVYAPADDGVIALEPMTAPTNALVSGDPDLVLLGSGEAYRATFSITVTGAG
jgi:galactose mutarotase-like enzyme